MNSNSLSFTPSIQMRIKDLSHSERVERARKIEVMMQLPRIMKQYESISAFDSDKVLPDDKEELYALISLPSKFSTFLRAAFLVRSNFDQWNALVRNPSSEPSSVFKSILDDKLLVFLLFWCDIIMVFHLDPRSPFLDCDKWHKENYLIYTNIDHEVGTEEKVLDFWAALGMPGKDTLWGKDMGELEMMRSETIGRERRPDNFCLGWYFYRIAYKFDLSFLTDINNGEASTDEMLFNMTEFVLKASSALAFDIEELSILETLMRLFPQFTQLVANVSKKYILDVNELTLSTVDYQHTKYRVLEEEFGCNLMYRSDYVNMFPCNQSLLKMFKRHPQLYTRWAVDAKMQHLYYMLVASPRAFLNRDK